MSFKRIVTNTLARAGISINGDNPWDIQVLLSGLEEEVPNNFRARLVIETGHPDEPRFESQITGIRMPGRR